MISGIIIIILLAAFVGILVWAYSPRRKQRFREAAALPLLEDATPPRARDAEDLP